MVLSFLDNALINRNGIDLWIFGCGEKAEPFEVLISADGNEWISLGSVSDRPAGIDIEPFLEDPDQEFHLVKIIDSGAMLSDFPCAGVDIDAVGAIGATQEIPFKRGDSNGDSEVNIGDAILILSYLFARGDPPPCHKSSDVNDSGVIDLSDSISILLYLFVGNWTPPAPFVRCGYDETPDKLPCTQFPPCAE